MDLAFGLEMSGGAERGAAIRTSLAGASALPTEQRVNRRPHRRVFLDHRARAGAGTATGTSGGTYQTGLLGEQAVADGLRRAGWRVLGTRVRTHVGELDLVVRRASTVAFVEVKTAGPGRVDVASAVDARSRSRIRRAAVLWMGTNPAAQRGVRHYRFDVYLVHRDADGVIERIEQVRDAF